MTISYARVDSAHASRYLQQLAKHWSHKFEVELTPLTARISLPFGFCELDADESGLDVRLTPDTGTEIDRFRTVVAEHLQRFGHRETLNFDWREVDGRIAS